MNLLQKIKNNKDLCFVDGVTGSEYTLSKLLFSFPKNNQKTLAFLYLDNSINSVEVYLSGLSSENTLVLLNTQLEEKLKLDLEEKYQPGIIYDLTRSKIPQYDLLECNTLFDAKIFSAKQTIATEIHEKCSVMLSTSGTTGSPKFVKLSETNLTVNAESINSYLPINKNDVTPLNLPLHYSYGLSIFNSNALAGGKIVCGLPDILQREFWSAFKKYGCTSLAGVPFVYEMLKRIGFLKKSYPSLRYLTQAGGNLNSNIKALFNDYCAENNIPFFVMYGQTEATARISYVPPKQLKEKINSIGLPIPLGKLRLHPDTSELLYEGPNIFGGYAENKEDLNKWEFLDILHTGDIATQDEDGYFHITGRIKRFVKLFGNRVNLDDIERFLSRTFTASVPTAIGLEDKYLLISYTGEELNLKLVKKRLFEIYKIHPNTIKIQQLETMPLTGNGKVDYKKIGQEYDV